MAFNTVDVRSPADLAEDQRRRREQALVQVALAATQIASGRKALSAAVSKARSLGASEEQIAAMTRGADAS